MEAFGVGFGEKTFIVILIYSRIMSEKLKRFSCFPSTIVFYASRINRNSILSLWKEIQLVDKMIFKLKWFFSENIRILDNVLPYLNIIKSFMIMCSYLS